MLVKRDPSDNTSHHESHLFAILFLALKSLSGGRLQILPDAINEILNTQNIRIDSQGNDEHPGSYDTF